MLEITINENNHSQTLNFKDISDLPHINQVERFAQMDKLLININKHKHKNGKDIIEYIKSKRTPNVINIKKITLLALMNYFQKKFVLFSFIVDLKRFSKKVRLELGSSSITITSKINNFPHLIGIRSIRNDKGEIITHVRPQDFLDGVLYQWVLINSHNDYNIDFEKLEVFSWIPQTLSNPTYILPRSAIRPDGTRFDADLIFIRQVTYSDKYAFHIIGLKDEDGNNFAFKSQFAISRGRQYRIKKMFDLEKAIYSFFEEKRKIPR